MKQHIFQFHFFFPDSSICLTSPLRSITLSQPYQQNEAGNRRSKMSSRPGGMILVHYSFNILIAEVV